MLKSIDLIENADQGQNGNAPLSEPGECSEINYLGLSTVWVATPVACVTICCKRAIIWHVCGIPSVLYTDNGTDFPSQRMKQVAADLKMQLILTTPGHPRGRGKIKRFFRTVNEMFSVILKAFSDVHDGSRPSPSRLEQKFRIFLLDVYHRKTSPEPPGAPVERSETNGFLPQMPDSLEQLDLSLMHSVRSRKLWRDGIHFERPRYLSPTLAAYVREEITVASNPRDMGEVRTFYRDKFLCRAISADLAGGSATLDEIVRARNIRRQELSETLRDRRQAIDSLLELRHARVEKPAHGKSQPQPDSSSPGLSATGTKIQPSELIHTFNIAAPLNSVKPAVAIDTSDFAMNPK